MQDILSLRSNFLEKVLHINKEELIYLDLDSNNYYLIEGLRKRLLPCDEMEHLELVHPSGRDCFKRVINTLLDRQSEFEKKDFYMLPDIDSGLSEEDYLLYSVYFIADADEQGRLNGIMISRRDVQHHQRIRQERDELFWKYQNTLNNMVSGLVYFDNEGRVLESNPAGERILRRMFGRDVYQLNVLEIKALQGECLERIKNHTAFNKVVRFDLNPEIVGEADQRCGTYRNVHFAELHYQPLFDAEGNFVINLIISKDVTKEELESLKNATYISQIRFINKYLGVSRVTYSCCMRSYSVEYYLAKENEWKNVPIDYALAKVHPDDAYLFKQMVQDADEGEKTTLDTSVRMRLEGYDEYRNVHFFFLRETDMTGKAASYTGVLIDLTERIMLEKAGERAHELINNIINNLPALVFVKDVNNEFRYLSVNNRFAQKYGLSTNSLVGKNDYDLITDSPLFADKKAVGITREEADQWRQKDLEALKYTEENPLVLWEEFREMDGTVSYLKTEKFRSRIQGEDMLIGTSTNVTDLQKARERAEQSDKLKSAFLMNMSHEIRTPLNSIVGFSELLMTAESDGDKQVYMNLIRDNNRNLIALIDSVIYLSKLESGIFEFSHLPIHAKDLVEEVYLRFDDRAHVEKHVELKKKIEGDRVVHQDSLQLSTALVHLINNALKFTPQGSVTIGCTPQDEGVCFWVEDTGVGIAPEDQERIFNRFEKVDYFIPGTGLGLCISKTIAEKMRGRIGLESEYGKGSRFWIWIPDK